MRHEGDLAPVIAEALHLYQQLGGFRRLLGESGYLKARDRT